MDREEQNRLILAELARLYPDARPARHFANPFELRRYCKQRGIVLGDVPVIKEARQMTSLLEGEMYFDRKETHPTREGVEVHVINIETLRAKGTPLTNFQDGTEPSEN